MLPTRGQFERIAFLGGFPPRMCGIATFTHDLCEAVAVAMPGVHCSTVAMNDRSAVYAYPPRVSGDLDEGDLPGYRRTAAALNVSGTELLCVQHEFGIYGGPAGSHLLSLLDAVRMPVVTTLHTVLDEPDDDQRSVMEALIRRSDRLVVMSHKGCDLLRSVYRAPADQIDLIPHGIPDVAFRDSSCYKRRFAVAGRQVLLTFGLLGPGKGIEYVIEALPAIIERHPDVVYLVMGATHPHLVASEGERYRLELERRVEELGLGDHVRFHNRFVSADELNAVIGAADIYVTPYLNEAQITSGTLAYVFGAGRAVVSTPYWHARELLSEGGGTLVPCRDAPAIAAAVGELLDHPDRLHAIQERNRQIGRHWVWPAVARQYLSSFLQARAGHAVVSPSDGEGWGRRSDPVALPGSKLDHLVRMSDGTGLFQHATLTVPNFDEGYSIDDNARAFIFCILLAESGARPPDRILDQLATSYLAYLSAAYNPETGRFRNFLSHARQWLEDSGSEDSHGRALWALGTGASRSATVGHRTLSRVLFERGLEVVGTFTSPRAWAFALLGLHEFARCDPEHPASLAATRLLSAKLVRQWHAAASDEWPWFEHSLSYDNARLCQALILSGQRLDQPEVLDIGLSSLRWLAALQTTRGEHFRPIGSDGFYPKGGVRADFDQQPVEAQAMVAACLAAHQATADEAWHHEATRAFDWFLGRNDLGLPLYDAATGGCRDGLHRDRVNQNQGAESTLAFHLALVDLRMAGHPTTVTAPVR